MENPQVIVWLDIEGQEILLPIWDKASIEVENREKDPAVLELKVGRADWKLPAGVLKVEANGKTFYISSRVYQPSLKVMLEPGQRAEVNFYLIKLPRIVSPGPSEVKININLHRTSPQKIQLVG
ncbi:MAG: hypothetical protein ABWK01_09215 [Infirmifilum sp.]